jgi:non-heme chloroperoxidase
MPWLLPILLGTVLASSTPTPCCPPEASSQASRLHDRGETHVKDSVLTPKVVSVNGVELHYVEQGSGTPVVLVHGSLADYSYWEVSQQMSLLSERYRVIAYSRRYNYPNQNPRTPDHSPMTEAQDLLALMDRLGLETVHLVGHSYGAYTALVFALEHAERLHSLVLAEPPIISWLPDIPGGEGVYEDFLEGVWQPLAQAFDQEGTQAGLDFTAQWYFQVPWEEIEPRWQVFFSRNAEEWHALAISRNAFPKLDYAQVRALAVPTLLLSGGANAGFARQVDAHLQYLLPQVERVVVPDASHEMFLDDSKASASAMLDFFQRR